MNEELSQHFNQEGIPPNSDDDIPINPIDLSVPQNEQNITLQIKKAWINYQLALKQIILEHKHKAKPINLKINSTCTVTHSDGTVVTFPFKPHLL